MWIGYFSSGVSPEGVLQTLQQWELCLAQKEIACSDRRERSQPGAPGDRGHIAWPWVLPWKQKWDGNGPAETCPREGQGESRSCAVTSPAVLGAVRDALAPLSGQWNECKVPAPGDTLCILCKDCLLSRIFCGVSSSLVYFP